MIFIQLIFLVCITGANYIINKKNILAPAVLISVMSCVCTCFCIINYDKWNLKTYSGKTLIVILLAVISFSFSSFFSSKIRLKIRERKQRNTVETYDVSNWFTIIISIVTSINAFVYYKEIYRIAFVAKSMYPIKTYSMLWYVRNIDTGLRVNTIVSSLTDVGYVISNLYIFFLIYNVVSTKKIRPYILYILPILIYVIQSLLFGGRTGLLQMATVAIVSFYYVVAVKRKFKFSNILRKYTGKIVIVLIIILVLFRLLNDISGRGKSEMSLLYYISVYIGSGMKNLDSFLQNNYTIQPKGFGWETFAGIYNFLKRFLGVPYDGLILEFQPSINGLFLGNIYTAIRRYYNDFGCIGVVVIPAILGWITTILERNCRETLKSLHVDSKLGVEVNCILYGIFTYGLMIFFIEDFVFLNIVSIDYFMKIIELYVIDILLLMLGVVKRNVSHYKEK